MVWGYVSVSVIFMFCFNTFMGGNGVWGLRAGCLLRFGSLHCKGWDWMDVCAAVGLKLMDAV